MQALEHFHETLGVAPEFERASLVNVAVLGEYDVEIEERLQRRFSYRDRGDGLTHGDFGFNEKSGSPAAVGVVEHHPGDERLRLG